MPIARIGKKQISYWIGRRGVLEGREIVLFIHGAGGGQFAWSFQKDFFEKQFNPIIIDLPGHGESGGEGEEEIGKYAEHVHSFLKALGLQKVFLVGHSMGGAIVQTLALTHPEVMKGIVLVGTGARLRVLPMILNGVKNNFEETIPKIVQFAYSRKAPGELIERGVSDLLKCRPETLYGDFLACDRFDVMNQVERIDLPTLVLCGDDDDLTPVKYSEFLHQHIKGSKLEILPNAGHMVMMESAEAFNEKVGEFIFDNRRGFKKSRIQGAK
jgi:pimeloyl-ACP methyl ester carboxylesterase